MIEQHKIAVVTGSNRGLGYAIAKKLGQIQGIRVVLTSRDQQSGRTAQEKLAQEGVKADYQTLDVTRDQSVQQFARRLQQNYGRIDILVNNAGVNPSAQLEEASMLSTQLETMLSTFATNVLAVARISQALIPLMKVHNYGRLVNVSTEMASLSTISHDHYPLAPSYRLSKVGLNGLTAILAKELKETNILVNAYSPGWLQTDMGGSNAPKTAEEGAETAVYLATLLEGGPQGKFFGEMSKEGEPIELPW